MPCAVRLLKGSHACVDGSFGCDPTSTSRFWVQDGCRGLFSCGGDGLAQQCYFPDTNSSRRAYCDCNRDEGERPSTCWREPTAHDRCTSKLRGTLWAQRPRVGRGGGRASPNRAAVCLVGHARTFASCAVHRSIKRHLLDALGRGATDLFALLVLEDAGTKLQDVRQVFNVAPTTPLLAAARALSVLLPRAVELWHHGPVPIRNSGCKTLGALHVTAMAATALDAG